MSLSLALTLLKVSVLGFSLTQAEVNIHFHLEEAEDLGTDYSADDKGGALPANLLETLLTMETRSLPNSQYPLARCNDGSQANYFHQPGRHKGKVMIWLEGGGLCFNKDTCDARCNTTNTLHYYCTAKANGTTIPREIWPTISRQGGLFDGHWMAWVHYCTSDLWSGTREALGYHFRGRQILEAVVKDLAENFDLKSASQIVLSGSSAGASGVTLNCDWFSESIRASSPTADVRCIADGADFYAPDVAPDCGLNNPDFQKQLAQRMGTVFDSSCTEYAANNSNDNVAALCGVTARNVRYITTPLLIMSSHLDPTIAPYFGCGNVSAEFFAKWAAGHAKEVFDLMTDRPDIAFYSPNCQTLHCMMYGYPDLRVAQQETGEQIGVADFINKWLTGDGKTPQHAIDDVTVANPTCPASF